MELIVVCIYTLNSIYLLLAGLNAYLACYRFQTARYSADSDLSIKRGIERYPKLLVQLPIYNERNSILELLESMTKCDYPGELVVQILDDSNDDTIQVVDQWLSNNTQSSIKFNHIIRNDRKGYKAGALKHGMTLESSDFIAIFDADFLPPSDFLKNAIIYLEQNQEIGLIQGRWTYTNENLNLWTRFQAIGMDGHFAIEQAARAWNNNFMNFNGTAGVWRRKCIDDAGGWHADTLTEDLDLSYRAQLKGWKLTYNKELICPSEIPNSVLAFKSQQFRWAKGSIQTAIKLLIKVLRSKNCLKLKIEATMHLTHYLIHPLLLINFLLGCLILNNQINLLWPQIEFVFLVILIACAGPSYLYRYAQKTLNKKLPFYFYPLMIALGCGLALNNSRAVFEAIIGRKSSFVRTPKEGNRTKFYRTNFDFWFLIELSLGVLGLTILAHSSQNHYFLVPFLALYSIGYLSIGLASAAEMLLSTKSQQKRSASLVMSTSSIDAKSEAAYVSEI